VNPLLRPVPLFCAETLARVASERKWVIEHITVEPT
jgi:sodium-dependent phosphate cotransporter